MSINHNHHHADHHHVKSYGKAFIIGISLNILFVLIEGGFGFKINSLALLADAGHNLSDVAGLILAWAGLAVARKKANEKHSYGWKKASVLAAFTNSLFLLVAMGSLAWEAIHRFQQPVQTEGLTIIAVASVGIVINLLTAFLFAAGRDQDINIRGAYLHMMTDALVSVGVVVAGALTLQFQSSWIDPITSLLIVVVVVFGTWELFIVSLRLLFDGVPEGIDINEIRKYLFTKPGVKDVFDLHVWAMSTTEVALTVHLQMPDSNQSDDFLSQVADELHNQFKIEHITLQVIKNPLKKNYCN